jgi:hypothetical protein
VNFAEAIRLLFWRIVAKISRARWSDAVAVHVIDGLEMSVDRGPNWLFVKLRNNQQGPRKATPKIADKLWSISSRHFIYRLVVELDEVEQLPASWVDELTELQQRLAECGGALRLCGMSPKCEETVTSQCEGSLFNHATRTEAVMGSSEFAVLPR